MTQPVLNRKARRQRTRPQNPRNNRNVRQSNRRNHAKLLQQVTQLAQNTEPNVMSPAAPTIPAEIKAITNSITAVIAHYAMKTELFKSVAGNNAAITPGMVGAYLYFCALSYIRRAGTIYDTSSSLIPDSPNWPVPMGFAKFLQGYGTYIEDGMVLKSSVYTLDLLPTITVSNDWPGSASDLLSSDPSGYTFKPIIDGNTTQDLYLPNFVQGTITLGDFSSFFDVIARALESSPGSLVRLEDIPLYAPNAAAYALPNAAVSTQAGTAWICPSMNFHSDEAMLYSYARVSNQTTTYQVTKPIMYSQYTGTGVLISCLQPIYTLVFALFFCRYKYDPKPIVGNLKYCETPLETLYCVPHYINYAGYDKVVADHYSALLTYWNTRNLTIASGAGTTTKSYDVNYRVFTSLYIIKAMITQWRFNNSVPFFTMGGTTQQPLPQIFYVSSVWSSLKLPSALADMFMAVGPVVYRNRLVVPAVFAPSAGVIPSPYSAYYGGFPLLTDANTRLNPYGYVYRPTTGGTAAGSTLVFEGVTINNTFLTKQTAILDITNNTGVIGVNALAEEPIRMYYEAMYSNTSGSALASSLVHMHYHNCGIKAVMLTQCDALPSAGLGTPVMPIDFQGTASSYDIMVPQDFSVTTVRSICQLTHNQVTIAIVYVLSNFNELNLLNYANGNFKFSIRIPSSTSSNLLSRQLVQETFSPDSGYSQAIAKVQATLKPTKFRTNVTHMYTKRPKCFWKDLFHDVLHTISPLLREGIGMAAGFGCGAAATALMQPELAPAAGGVCTAGAQMLYDTLASNIGIQDADSTPTKEQSKVGTVPTKRQKDSALRSALSSAGVTPPPKAKAPQKRRATQNSSKVSQTKRVNQKTRQVDRKVKLLSQKLKKLEAKN